jgi:hypothetical protein
MLRTQLLIDGLESMENEVSVLSPYPDPSNKYYVNQERNQISTRVRIIFFGKKNYRKEAKLNKGKLGYNSIRKIYKTFDLFGSTIMNVRYVNEIIDKIDSFYDRIISVSDPKTSHILANKILKHVSCSSYIQYWGDPLAIDITNNSKLPQSFKKAVEKSLIKKANRVIYVSPITLLQQKKLFPRNANKMEMIPPPCRIGKVGRSKKKKNSTNILFGYFGSYNQKVRNIIPLVEVVKNEKQWAHLLIVGDSDIKIESGENITVMDRIPDEQLDGLLEECDVIIDLLNFKGSQIPGKVFRDAGTTKEVLLLLDGNFQKEIYEYFVQFNRYSFCKNLHDEIKLKLQEYLKNGVPVREPLGAFRMDRIASEIIQ